MATYQQRIALKGTESTITHFTNLLRETKDLFSINSADVITNAIQHWRENGYKTLLDKNLNLNLITKYFRDSNIYNSRIFHLQLLTSTEIMSRINSDVDRLKRDTTLKNAIEMYGIGEFSRGSAEFQLVALITVLEYYRLSSPLKTSKAYMELSNTRKPPLPAAPSPVTNRVSRVDLDRQITSMHKDRKNTVTNNNAATRYEGVQVPSTSPLRDIRQRQYSTENAANRPPLPVAPSPVTNRLSRVDLNRQTTSMQKETNKILTNNNAATRYEGVQVSSTSPFRDLRQGEYSTEDAVNKGIEEYRRRRGQSSIDYGTREDKHIKDTTIGSSKHLISWRARIREQQLAENRKLNESIRNTVSCSREGTPMSNSSLENRGSRWSTPSNNTPTSLTNKNDYNRSFKDSISETDIVNKRKVLNQANDTMNNINCLIKHDNRAYDWTPVHQVDIRKRAFGIPSNSTTPCNNSLSRDNDKINLSSNFKNIEDKENIYNYNKEKDSPIVKRRFELDQNNNYCDLKHRQLSEPPKTLPKPENSGTQLILKSNSSIQTKNGKVSLKLNIDLDTPPVNVLKLKERKIRSDRAMTGYLMVVTPDRRNVPGFIEPLNVGERMRNGVDCDEVFPNIILGNGATLKRKEYLKSIGVTHILNAAEYRGVNIGQDYFGEEFHYMGLRIEDTPQTQICR